MTTTSTVVDEYWDDDEAEGGWPAATRHIETLIEGDLADAIRQRSGRDGDVRIFETITNGGYSEYTQEDWNEFRIEVGGLTVFESESSSTYYNGIFGSSLTRLNDWIQEDV